MGFFFAAQFLCYLSYAGPHTAGFRGVLLVFLVLAARGNPLAALSGALWELLNLGAHPALRCDPKFWFVCSNAQPGMILIYLTGTPIGRIAMHLQVYFEGLCLAWHPLWGRLASSLLMGGQAADDFKSLYKNLGFLHVLVISGSQFVLLSQALAWFTRLPLRGFYALRLLRWPNFRWLSLFMDLAILAALLLYLLACGTTPPCQRAFLSLAHRSYGIWLKPPRPSQGRPAPSSAVRVFWWQALLFPEACFSLSSLLSWGAALSLQIFRGARRWSAQLKISLLIQLLNLALFGRLSLASLCLDFFISPLWDLLLFLCLAAVLILWPPLQNAIASGLDFLHQSLLLMDRWEWQTFGSSALGFRAEIGPWGSTLALTLFALWLCSGRAKRILVREKRKGEGICAPS